MTLDERTARHTRWIAVAGLVALVAMALATIGDVLLRWLFNSPIDGVDEVSRLVVAIVIASFFPVALIEHHHISIRFVGSALGPRVSAWLEALAALVTSLFFLILGWQFIRYTVELNEAGETTWLLGWPVAPWWATVTVFMLVCLPVQGMVIWSRVRIALRGGDTPVTSTVDPTDTEY